MSEMFDGKLSRKYIGNRESKGFEDGESRNQLKELAGVKASDPKYRINPVTRSAELKPEQSGERKKIKDMTSEQIEEMLVIPSSEEVLGCLQKMLSYVPYKRAVKINSPFFRYLFKFFKPANPQIYAHTCSRVLTIMRNKQIEPNFSEFLTMNETLFQEYMGSPGTLANIRSVDDEIRAEIKAYQDKQSVNSESESAPE